MISECPGSSSHRLVADNRKGIIEEDVKTCHIVYQRDGIGCWVASVRELRGCHTQGRTIDEARRRIAEAMELFVANVRSTTIVDDIPPSEI